MDFSLNLDLSKTFEVINVKSNSGNIIQGKRFTIQDVIAPCVPLPSDGKVTSLTTPPIENVLASKICVTYGDQTIESHLKLPTSCIKTSEGTGRFCLFFSYKKVFCSSSKKHLADCRVSREGFLRIAATAEATFWRCASKQRQTKRPLGPLCTISSCLHYSL